MAEKKGSLFGDIILEDEVYPDNPKERAEMEYCIKKTEEGNQEFGVPSDSEDWSDDEDDKRGSKGKARGAGRRVEQGIIGATGIR